MVKLTERDLQLAGVNMVNEGYSFANSIVLLKELSKELHQAERYEYRDAVDFAIIELEKQK